MALRVKNSGLCKYRLGVCTYVLCVINSYEHKTMLVVNYHCLFKILNSCLKPEKKRLDDNRESGACKEEKKFFLKANTLWFSSSSNIRQKFVVERTFICQISSAVEFLPDNKYV